MENLHVPDQRPLATLKNLLFITWDSDTSNYLETLFFPILQGLQERGVIKAHVLQFSWAQTEEVARLSQLAKNASIGYKHFKIARQPHPMLGVISTLLKGRKRIKAFCEEEKIDLLMPRSTMPATMVNGLFSWLKEKKIQVIFDADGLPIRERVDYTGLNENGLQYKFLINQENKILERSDRVITRTKASLDWHLEKNPNLQKSKFQVVSNGRDQHVFKPDHQARSEIRQRLGLNQQDILLIHSGSFGQAYAPDQTREIFTHLISSGLSCYLLFLTRSKVNFHETLPLDLKTRIIEQSVAYSEVPQYLNAADFGLCLRTQAMSLKGIAPIKLGEYLLSGLPVIISPEIGDMENLLKGFDFYLPYRNKSDLENLTKQIKNIKTDRKAIRTFAIDYFTLDKSLNAYQKVINSL